MSGIPDNVKRGVALLDQRLPNWRERVNTDTLDLGDGCNCVLAQVLGGDYDDAAHLLGFDWREASSFGFFKYGRQTWEALTSGWIRALVGGEA